MNPCGGKGPSTDPPGLLALRRNGLFPLQIRIARAMTRREVKEGDILAPQGRAEIVLLSEGLVTVFLGARPIENLKPGGFFGEETLMRGARELPAGWKQRFTRPVAAGREAGTSYHLFEARALMDPVLYAIPAEAIEDIPVVQWKLMETYERRLKGFRAEVRFVWHDSYNVGIPEMDEQHRLLFDMIEGLAAVAEDGHRSGDGMMDTVDRLIALTRSHLQYEETLAARVPNPAYESVIRDHSEVMRKVEGLSKYLEKAPVDALHTMVEFLKDWVIDHALIEDRRFRESLQPSNGIIGISRALDFAARKHAHQRRKGLKAEPYINHLTEVALHLAEASDGDDPQLVMAGLLHDTIEDTETTRDELAAAFGEDVASLVVEVTDDTGLPRDERKRRQVDCCRQIGRGPA